MRLCKRHRLPRLSRQVERGDSQGRRRWLDAYLDDYGLAIEVDGAGHLEARQWWADLARLNDLTIQGDGLLRFPS